MQAWQLDTLCLFTGAFTGSFLNCYALHTLYNEPGHREPLNCPKCNFSPPITERIPILSFVLSNGKCRRCKSPIPWQYPLAEIVTALTFLIIVRFFGLSIYGFGMLFFACTLIAVSITDFKEKLIPHEITYPSILCGIIFSTSIRHDLWGTLAGIGISYICFDFLAFYGLKVYLKFKTPREEAAKRHMISHQLDNQFSRIKEKWRKPNKLAHSIEINQRSISAKAISKRQKGEPESEDFEVMGGGDAVLSALISAWLGLPRLLYALLIGFIIGTVMGAGYLIVELYKQRLLHTIARPALLCTGVSMTIFALLLLMISAITHAGILTLPWVPLGILAIFTGVLMSIVVVGGRYSKPFPFGPALALGAALAIFQPQDKFGG